MLGSPRLAKQPTVGHFGIRVSCWYVRHRHIILKFGISILVANSIDLIPNETTIYEFIIAGRIKSGEPGCALTYGIIPKMASRFIRLTTNIGHPKLFMGGEARIPNTWLEPTVNNFAGERAGCGFGWSVELIWAIRFLGFPAPAG